MLEYSILSLLLYNYTQKKKNRVQQKLLNKNDFTNSNTFVPFGINVTNRKPPCCCFDELSILAIKTGVFITIFPITAKNITIKIYLIKKFISFLEKTNINEMKFVKFFERSNLLENSISFFLGGIKEKTYKNRQQVAQFFFFSLTNFELFTETSL
ncbi:hypothetical protein RFI_32375 [Reticulomyxa filosa]|uniref:Uncharacterized protein n=1 Tax=Reticulomyxa filosa TaxID=46433 RepID=X6LUH2_RETFI|nr:hypothetical protein RFI_32375 [Reticulomyxa filosa]|eukprot:ETO05021.1 hypothetical protein RFI_32375 [Reticulomyxa filosa]